MQSFTGHDTTQVDLGGQSTDGKSKKVPKVDPTKGINYGKSSPSTTAAITKIDKEVKMKKVAEDADMEMEEFLVDEEVEVPATKQGMMKDVYEFMEDLDSDEAERVFGAVVKEAKKMSDEVESDDDSSDDDKADDGEELDELSQDLLKRSARKAGSQANMSKSDAGFDKRSKQANKFSAAANRKVTESDETLIKRVARDDINVDMKEDITAILSGQELSEEFTTQAVELFEAAVSAKVISISNAKIEQLEETYHADLDAKLHEGMTSLETEIDEYLTYVAEEWAEENKLAIERGIKEEMVESFIDGIKNVFVEHYVQVPEEKENILEDLASHAEKLEEEVNVLDRANMKLIHQIKGFRKNEIIGEATSGLTDLQSEKLGDLSEGLEFVDEVSFARKLEIIKENYFTSDTAISDTAEVLEEEVTGEELVEAAAYRNPDVTVDNVVNLLTRSK